MGISPTAINVSWSSIPGGNNIDVVIGYIVYYYKNGNLHNITTSSTQTELTISNLAMDTVYSVMVAGLSPGGEGDQGTSDIRTLIGGRVRLLRPC